MDLEHQRIQARTRFCLHVQSSTRPSSAFWIWNTCAGQSCQLLYSGDKHKYRPQPPSSIAYNKSVFGKGQAGRLKFCFYRWSQFWAARSEAVQPPENHRIWSPDWQRPNSLCWCAWEPAQQMLNGEHQSYSSKRYLDVTGHLEQMPTFIADLQNASFLNTTDFKCIEVYNSLIKHQPPLHVVVCYSV